MVTCEITNDKLMTYTRLQRAILAAIDNAFPKGRPWNGHDEVKIMMAVRKGVLRLLGEKIDS